MKDVIVGVAEKQLIRGVIQSADKSKMTATSKLKKVAMQQSQGKWAHKQEMVS